MNIVPTTIKAARIFVARHHRHHQPPRGGLFACAVEHGGDVIGVAIVGRPVARELQDGRSAEVTRLCVSPTLTAGLRGLCSPVASSEDDTPGGACSMLYGACWRAARSLGYRRLLTYILDTEVGLTLRAAGWRCLGAAGGGSWSCPSRPRKDGAPQQGKLRWQAESLAPATIEEVACES